MSFLAPFFLLGGLAVALPILFHLIRRTTRDKVPISSLMFLVPSPPRITRRSRLENLLLLLLRCLVLCLLALGFARPFLQKPMAASPDASEGQDWIILVDSSASMQREDLWDQARDRVQTVLSEVLPADAVALYAFDRRIRPLMSFDQWTGTPESERIPSTLEALQDFQPGWANTHLADALLSSVEILEELDSRQTLPGQRKIVLISDMQEGSRSEGLQGFEWPDRLRVRLETLSVKRPTNAGLQVLPPPTMGPGAGDDRLRVRLVNVAESDLEQFQLNWSRQSTGADDSIKSHSLDVYVPPGQNRVITVPTTPGEKDHVKLELIGDGTPFDNISYYVPLLADRLEVMFLGDDKASDPNQLLFYLDREFQETSRQIVKVVPYPADQVLPPSKLSSSKLAVVAGAQSPERTAWLQSFMEQGGTVLLVMRQAAESSTLRPLTGLDELKAEEAKVDDYAMLGQIDFSHPLFAPFADPRFSDFTKVNFWKHRKLDVNSLTNASVLARFDDGDPALLQLSRGNGLLLVMTSGWHPHDSQLALSTKFVPLLYSLLEVSGALISRPSEMTVGDAIQLAGTNNASGITIRRPDGAETNLVTAQAFSGTDQPGIYTIVSEEGSRSLAVNMASEESRTSPMVEEAWEDLGVPLVQADLTIAQNVEKEEESSMLQARELENRQKLWRWLILVALGLLLIESWLAGRLSRQAPVEPSAT